jgi:hypothetical protein
MVSIRFGQIRSWVASVFKFNCHTALACGIIGSGGFIPNLPTYFLSLRPLKRNHAFQRYLIKSLSPDDDCQGDGRYI